MPKVGARATPTLVLYTQKLLLSEQEILLQTLSFKTLDFGKLKLFTKTLCLVTSEYLHYKDFFFCSCREVLFVLIITATLLSCVEWWGFVLFCYYYQDEISGHRDMS